MKLQIEVSDEIGSKFKMLCSANRKTQNYILTKMFEDFFAQKNLTDEFKAFFSTAYSAAKEFGENKEKKDKKNE